MALFLMESCLLFAPLWPPCSLPRSLVRWHVAGWCELLHAGAHAARVPVGGAQGQRLRLPLGARRLAPVQPAQVAHLRGAHPRGRARHPIPPLSHNAPLVGGLGGLGVGVLEQGLGPLGSPRWCPPPWPVCASQVMMYSLAPQGTGKCATGPSCPVRGGCVGWVYVCAQLRVFSLCFLVVAPVRHLRLIILNHEPGKSSLRVLRSIHARGIYHTTANWQWASP